MKATRLPVRRRRMALAVSLAAVAGSVSIFAVPATADATLAFRHGPGPLTPGNLLVTTGVWTTNADITAGTTQLPPNCATANPAYVTCGTAVAPGTYPIVFNNDASDGSFGVTEPIVLDELNPHNGRLINAVPVPDNPADGDYLTTSFSSKSELAVNQSTDGRYDTFVGYVAPPGTIDASNANTPGEIDPTIADSATPVYRAVAQVNARGQFEFTETNAFSGDNGRAAVLDPEDGPGGTIFAAGNAGNGASPEPAAVIDGAGSQILAPAHEPEAAQDPGTPTPFGNFNIAELGDPADKSGKDDNYRGLAVYDGVVYFTKGSGGNGVDTVYFADPNGSATAANGVGLPSTSETLPSASPGPDQRLHPEGLPDRPGQERDGCVGLPVRALVRQPDHAVRGRRGRGRQHLRRRDQHLHRGRRFDDRRLAEVVVQLLGRRMAAGLRAADRPRPRHAL
jgi:hypothetical protein